MKLDFSVLNQTEVIITLVLGVLLLLFGYKIKKIAFFIIWFLLGYALMTHLMPFINQWSPDIATNDLWQWLLPLAGGLLLALMGFTIEKVCVGGIAFGLTLAIAAQYFGTDVQVLAIAAVIGVILAGAAVMLMKPAIIIATAIAGAYTITTGILFFATAIDATTFYFPILIGTTAIGSVVQFTTTRHE